MKTVLSLVTLTIGLMTLPLSVYASWILYNHIKATELMWFIWWIQLPLTVLVTVLSQIVKTMSDKE
jgi:hypothetical protein